jgi:hypothetical protein
MQHFERATSAAARICLALTFFVASCICASAQGRVNDGSGQPRRVIHVIVALCDNVHQGIVPVPAKIGNGDDPEHNLYWGAAFGVKTFFTRSQEWTLLARRRDVNAFVLERLVFKHRRQEVYLVADAYRGAEIKRSLADFLDHASGRSSVPIDGVENLHLRAGGSADLVVFVGHNGLMDFSLDAYPTGAAGRARDAFVLSCASKAYFTQPLKQAGASPVLWTTGLMAPEAYVLKAAIDGWIVNENGEAIRTRAAAAYQQYQKCGLKAARHLFASGW